MLTENTFVEMWLHYHYPLTIIADRYSGTYSGGEFMAFPLEYTQIPEQVSGGDTECHMFWAYNKIPVGKGISVEEAYKNLVKNTEEIQWQENNGGKR
jgi:hypothetical protein